MASKFYVPFAIAFIALAAAPAIAQQSGRSGQSAQQQSEQREHQQSQQRIASEQSATSTAGHEFLKTAIQDNIAEIKVGQLAMERGQSQQVKDLGKTLAQDHTKGLAEALQTAVAMNMVAPTEPSQAAQQQYDKLKGLSGQEFDKQFLSDAVKDHQKAIDLFSQQEQSAQSTELQQLAKKQLPTLKKHLEMAQAAQKGSGEKLGANLPGHSEQQQRSR